MTQAQDVTTLRESRMVKCMEEALEKYPTESVVLTRAQAVLREVLSVEAGCP